MALSLPFGMMSLPLFWMFAAVPFWLPLIVAAIVARPTFLWLVKMKSRQTVSEYAPEGHQKKQGTPTMGGIIIVFGVAVCLVTALLLKPLDISESEMARLGGRQYAWLAAALILLLGFAFIGFVDDFLVPRLVKGKRGLGWKQKILMQFVVAVAGAGVACGWGYLPKTALCVFLILFASNAFNFLDGLDALAGSVLMVLAMGLLMYFRGTATGVPADIVLYALVGATVPFLFLNAPPARVFMGDVGSLPIGALLGLVASSLLWDAQRMHFLGGTTVLTEFPGAFRSEMVVVLLIIGFILIAELVPVPLQIFWVKVFKKKLFPYTPIHHAFEKAGWPESRVVWSFLLAQFVLVELARTVPALLNP